MATTALTDLQQQIEALRREAFAAGYEIRRALEQMGVSLAFTSIRHALGQLEERGAAPQVGSSKNVAAFRCGLKAPLLAAGHAANSNDPGCARNSL